MSGFEAYPRLYQEKSAVTLTLLRRWRSYVASGLWAHGILSSGNAATRRSAWSSLRSRRSRARSAPVPHNQTPWSGFAATIRVRWTFTWLAGNRDAKWIGLVPPKGRAAFELAAEDADCPLGMNFFLVRQGRGYWTGPLRPRGDVIIELVIEKYAGLSAARLLNE